MKKYLAAKVIAGGAAITMLFSGFTYPSTKLPNVSNQTIQTLSEMAGGVSKEKKISFGNSFKEYNEEKILLSSKQMGIYNGYTAKEIRRPDSEQINIEFSKANAISTLFDFTLTQTKKHTIKVQSDLKGKAKIILTKDKKVIFPIWENGEQSSASKTLTLEKGRYRVRLVTSDASGKINISLDEKHSLFSYTVEKAEQEYDKIMKPAVDTYQKEVKKAHERYDKSLDGASDLYSKETDKASDKYYDELDRIGDFEYSSYLEAKEGKEMDKEYTKKYSKIENQYEQELSNSKGSYEELIQQAEKYLQERLNKAGDELKKASEKANKAWDAIIG